MRAGLCLRGRRFAALVLAFGARGRTGSCCAWRRLTLLTHVWVIGAGLLMRNVRSTLRVALGGGVLPRALLRSRCALLTDIRIVGAGLLMWNILAVLGRTAGSGSIGWALLLREQES